jgi:hypothetical protein
VVGVSELRSAVDELAAVDLTELSGAELLSWVVECSSAVNRLQAQLARGVRAAEAADAHAADGAVSMKAWLRGHCRLAASEATAVVGAGRRLAQLPALAAAFADGEVTAQHVRVVSGAVTPERVARAAAMGVDPGETDRILTSLAVQTVPEETAKAARRWVSGWIPTVHWTPPTCAAG